MSHQHEQLMRQQQQQAMLGSQQNQPQGQTLASPAESAHVSANWLSISGTGDQIRHPKRSIWLSRNTFGTQETQPDCLLAHCCLSYLQKFVGFRFASAAFLAGSQGEPLLKVLRPI